MSTVRVALDLPGGQHITGQIPYVERPKMQVGIHISPVKSYTTWLPKLTPAFAGVYVPPGGPIPQFGKSPNVTGLPAYCPPWINHKDEWPLSLLDAYWSALPDLMPGRKYRWTFHREAAPEKDRKRYLTYWNTLVSLHSDHPRAADIELIQVQTSYALRWRRDTRWQDWIIPGVTFGLDYYPPAFGTGYEPPESGFAIGRAAADLADADFCIGEWGAEPREGVNRAEYFRHGLEVAQGMGCTAVGFWCGTEKRDGKQYDYRPDKDTLQVWKEAMQ